MLTTHLTQTLGLRYPILSAPMAGVARGRLARAVTDAGGLGFIGVGSTAAPDMPARESAVAREGNPARKFGIGLMGWAIDKRPELLDASIAARPTILAISFGLRPEWVRRCHDAGILVAAQVQTGDMAIDAEQLGADLIVAQGTDAGGHTGAVGTLPLLQIVLRAVKKTPVLAAGGIASPEGVAAVLAAGAQGAWIGTALLATPESDLAAEGKRRVIAARETDTILTHVFDWAGRFDWPQQFPGRSLVNDYARTWHARQDDLKSNPAEHARYADADRTGNFDVRANYAGQAVGMVTAEERAADVIRRLGENAETLLRRRTADLLK